MKELTKRQNQVLNIIKYSIQERGIAPTHKEISEILGASSYKTAADHLRVLERKGYIKIHKGTSRGIQVLDRGASDDNDK